MVSPVDLNEHILLQPADAVRYHYDTPARKMIPYPLEDGRFFLTAGLLEDPAFHEWIPDLLGHPRCKVELIQHGDSEPPTFRVVPGSEYAPDISPRTYTPKDNAYERPTLPPIGDWSEAKLYEWIGRSLTAWETVEVALSNLFVSLLSPIPYQLPAHRAYGAVISAMGRIDLLKNAAAAFFEAFPDGAMQIEVKKQLDRAGKFSGRRNEIAHGMVSTYLAPDAVNRGLALLPPIYAANKRNIAPSHDPSRFEPVTQPIYAYTSVELSYFADQFRQLSVAIDALYLHLHRDFPPEVFEQLTRTRLSP